MKHFRSCCGPGSEDKPISPPSITASHDKAPIPSDSIAANTPLLPIVQLTPAEMRQLEHQKFADTDISHYDRAANESPQPSGTLSSVARKVSDYFFNLTLRLS